MADINIVALVLVLASFGFVEVKGEEPAVYETNKDFGFSCQTEEGYTDRTSRKARMKFVKDDKTLYDVETDKVNYELEYSGNRKMETDSKGRIIVTLNVKAADLNDTGQYKCFINDNTTASASKNIIVVERVDEPTFVKAGTREAEFACLTDPPTNVVCRWYINQKQILGENCTHQKLPIKEDVMEDGLNVNCTVESRVDGASSRNLQLEKRVVVYTCDNLRDQQPFTCTFRANVIPNTTVTFYHGGSPTLPDCPETEGLLTCTGKLPRIDGSARLVVTWEGQDLVNISFTEFLKAVEDDGNGNGLSTGGIVGIVVAVLFPGIVLLCYCCRHKLPCCEGNDGNGEAPAVELKPMNLGGGAAGSDPDETVVDNTKPSDVLLKMTESENGEA